MNLPSAIGMQAGVCNFGLSPKTKTNTNTTERLTTSLFWERQVRRRLKYLCWRVSTRVQAAAAAVNVTEIDLHNGGIRFNRTLYNVIVEFAVSHANRSLRYYILNADLRESATATQYLAGSRATGGLGFYNAGTVSEGLELHLFTQLSGNVTGFCATVKIYYSLNP